MASSQHKSYLKSYLENRKKQNATAASGKQDKPNNSDRERASEKSSVNSKDTSHMRYGNKTEEKSSSGKQSRSKYNGQDANLKSSVNKTKNRVTKSAKERIAYRQEQHALKIAYSRIPGAAPIDWLPDELILEIYTYLSPQDLLNCGRVCKRWHILASDNLLWQVIYKQYASNISKAQKKQKPVKLPKDNPPSFWKSYCIQRGAEYRNNRASKLIKQKRVNPFTGLPRGTSEAIQKSGLRFVLSFVDMDSQEHTIICQDVFFFNMSVCVRWYNFELPSVHRIQNLRIYSGNPIFFDENGQALQNSPLQRSILYERDFKLGQIITNTPCFGSDNIINLYHLTDGLFIATWKDETNLAFISMNFHIDHLLERCLQGTPTRPWMPAPHKPFIDDIDPKYGLHGYTCTLELRNIRTSIWSQQFLNLYCLKHFQDGFAVMQLIDPERSYERSWIERKITLPWRTEILKGIVKDVCLLDVTLLDDQGKPIWCSCGLTKIRTAEDTPTVTYEYEGDYFIITYEDEQLGKVIMILIWEEPSKKFYITSLQVHLSLRMINYWFGTRY